MDCSGSIRITIGNTYRPFLEHLKDVFGGCLSINGSGTNRQMHTWSVCGGEAQQVIQLVLPYLREKRPQALVLLESVAYPFRSARREALRRHLKAMKRIEHA